MSALPRLEIGRSIFFEKNKAGDYQPINLVFFVFLAPFKVIHPAGRYDDFFKSGLSGSQAEVSVFPIKKIVLIQKTYFFKHLFFYEHGAARQVWRFVKVQCFGGSLMKRFHAQPAYRSARKPDLFG